MPVVPSPKSPIQVLADALTTSAAMNGFAKVLVGKNQLAANRSPPSVVIFPVEAGYQAAFDNVESMIDIDLKLAARLWGASVDQTWDLRQRFVQALRQQATGEDGENSTPDEAGMYYQLISEEWDVSPDTSSQGQELEILFTGRFSAAPTVQLRDGLVNATAINGLQTSLSVALAQFDATATVESTAGFPTAGELSIEREQLSYTGVTATSFTGLTRGINGTLSAAHDSAQLATLIP